MQAFQVFFSGRVHGVGFRYMAKRIAAEYEVTGWVKNLPDGRVELLAQAVDAAELDAFLETIKTSSLAGGIRDVEVHSVPPQEGLRGFTITH